MKLAALSFCDRLHLETGRTGTATTHIPEDRHTDHQASRDDWPSIPWRSHPIHHSDTSNIAIVTSSSGARLTSQPIIKSQQMTAGDSRLKTSEHCSDRSSAHDCNNCVLNLSENAKVDSLILLLYFVCDKKVSR